MKAILAALGVLALAASASAATLKVPQQYDTIQEAVNAAAEGDTIVVSKGVYYEQVSVNTAGLTIIGKKAVIDGTYLGGKALVTAAESGYYNCMDVYGAGVTIQGMQFRNGYNHVNFSTESIRILKCTSRNAAYAAFTGSAGSYEISGNRIFGHGYRGIYTESGETLISKNSIRQGGGSAIEVYSSSSVIDSNTIATIASGSGINQSGNGATLNKNRISNTGSTGIYVSGSSATITANRVSWTSGDTGIYVSGNGALVQKNIVTVGTNLLQCYGTGGQVLDNKVSGGLTSYGIIVGGDDITVTGNLVQQIAEYGTGFYIYSNGSGGGTVANNTAEDASGGGFSFNAFNNGSVSDCKAVRCGSMGYLSGFAVYGSGSTFTNCSSTESDGDGFYVNASNTTFVTCTSVGAAINGFRVYGPNNSFTSCSAKGTGGQGFHNVGPGTVLSGGVFTDNRIDIANEVSNGGTFAGGIGSVLFDTGGETMEPEVFYYPVW